MFPQKSIHITPTKKLVLVSSIIHGVWRASFQMIEPDGDGKFRVPQDKIPGVEPLMRGETFTVA